MKKSCANFQSGRGKGGGEGWICNFLKRNREQDKIEVASFCVLRISVVASVKRGSSKTEAHGVSLGITNHLSMLNIVS